MTHWPTVKAGLEVWLKRLSGLTLAQSEPGTWKMPPDKQQALCSFHVAAIKPIGRDETRRSYDTSIKIPGDVYEPDPDDPTARLGGVVYEVTGNREWQIEVRVACSKQDPSGIFYIQKIRDRLMLPSSLRDLRAVGLALSRTGAEGSFDQTDEGGRTVSVYVLEVFCNGASGESDDPITTIEVVDTVQTVAPF